MTVIQTLRYDVILTSETIYNTDNYKKLLTTMSELLKPTGTMYPYFRTSSSSKGTLKKKKNDLVKT